MVRSNAATVDELNKEAYWLTVRKEKEIGNIVKPLETKSGLQLGKIYHGYDMTNLRNHDRPSI